MTDGAEKYFGPRKPISEKKGKPGQTYPDRLLSALVKIIEDSNSSVSEKLQAIELSTKILPLRRPYRRKTDKERLVIAALQGKKKTVPKDSQ